MGQDGQVGGGARCSGKPPDVAKSQKVGRRAEGTCVLPGVASPHTPPHLQPAGPPQQKTNQGEEEASVRLAGVDMVSRGYVCRGHTRVKRSDTCKPMPDIF